MAEGPKDSLIPIPPPGQQQRLFRWFFFALLAFLIYQLILILSLFADAFIWAGSLTLVFWPIYRALEETLPGKPTLASGLSTTIVLLLVLVPVSVLFYIVMGQSSLLYSVVEEWLTALQDSGGVAAEGVLPDFLQEALQQINVYVSSLPMLARFDFNEFLLNNVSSINAILSDLGTATARNILLGFINLLLIIALMYFCFRDGRKFLAWFFEVIPMETSHAEAISFRVYQMVTAVIRGALITATVQGGLATVGYLVAGVPLALLFGTLTGFFSLVPVVGAGIVWFPLGIFMMSQSSGWGIFILVWGFFVVSLIDNLLKPILIGSQTRMPILLIFCAMIGGASIYGVTGFIIGPILISVLLACIKIYRDDYLQIQDTRGS